MAAASSLHTRPSHSASTAPTSQPSVHCGPPIEARIRGIGAKLLAEGYTGYMIRTTNDDMAGQGTNAETALANEKDVHELVRVMGLKRDFSLNYSNHEMDGISRPELRSRLIFLFRLLKV